MGKVYHRYTFCPTLRKGTFMKRHFIQSLLVTSIALTLAACASGGAGTAETPDGDKIDLSGSPQGTVTADTSYGNLTGQNNEYSFYGLWQSRNGSEYELRYQGTAATDIPKSGKATYVGDAIWMGSVLGSYNQGGSTTLNVDFGQKTVDGKIAFSALNDLRSRDITLHKTQLDGSKFSGKASVLFNDGGTYEGALFGKGAKETAGMVKFKNDSDLNVVFGGKRR